MKGLIWFFICMRRPRPRSTMVGKLSSRSVWPVGAVSKTTTEKFIPFTSLGAEVEEWCQVSRTALNQCCCTDHEFVKLASCCTSWPRRSSWPHRCQGRRSWPLASSSCPCWACCLPQRTHRAARPRPGWGRSPALMQAQLISLLQSEAPGAINPAINKELCWMPRCNCPHDSYEKMTQLSKTTVFIESIG